jgi:gamma-glutamyltranspeptidase
VVADLLLYRLDPVEAMTKTRFHHQLFPNEVIVDDGADPRMLQDLIAKGHIVQ